MIEEKIYKQNRLFRNTYIIYLTILTNQDNVIEGEIIKKKAKEEGIEIIKVYTEEKSAKTPYVRKAFQEMCEQISK